MDGAAVLIAAGGVMTDVAAASGLAATGLAEIEFAMGEGPVYDAHRDGVAVHEPDLSQDGLARWPGFARAALDAGIRAVFAFPLQAGAVRLGALEVCRTSAGALSGATTTDAINCADVATHIVLNLQAGVPEGELPARLADPGDDRLRVYQATGMVAAMVESSVADALALLRARAHATDASLYDVASDVVSRRLRFEP
jgi:hypothetical protein